MPDREVSTGVSSQDEPLNVEGMIEKYNEIQESHVSNPKDYEPGCNGNIATECIIEGLHNFSEMYEENDIDTALYGGLATQLRALADSGEFLRVLEPKNFGRRYTSDIDALVTDEDYAEMNEALRGYNFDGKAEVDFKRPYIPGTEEIIEEAEDIDFSKYHEEYDFTLPVPKPEHLVFTKAFQPIGDKKGTKHDLRRHFRRDDLFNMNESELTDFVNEHAADREQTFEILEQFGFEPNSL